jgi:hypothetical protein
MKCDIHICKERIELKFFQEMNDRLVHMSEETRKNYILQNKCWKDGNSVVGIIYPN